MAENRPDPSDPFTGRLYYFEFGIRIVVPIPLGEAPTVDPLVIRERVGSILHRAIQTIPLITSFKLLPLGQPRSEAAFQPHQEAMLARMKEFLMECEVAPHEKKLILMPHPGGNGPTQE